MKLAARIRRLRTENNWTQKDLAKRLGVSQQTVSEWEVGTGTHTILTAFKLAQLLRPRDSRLTKLREQIALLERQVMREPLVITCQPKPS